MMAMKDKPLLAAVAILIMLAAGVQGVRVINANPWIIWHTVDPIPNSTPPTIGIFSPLNNTIYPSKTILFSFNTSKPSAPIPVAGMGIAMVRYSLDNVNPNSSSFFEQTTGLYYCTSTGGSSSGGAYVGLPDFSYSNTLNLTEGNHSLTVFSDGVISPGNLTMFWIGSNATVYFTIDTNKTQIETPAPTLFPSSSPSMALSPTLSSTPTLESALSASLSESASALNFGNTINFTVSVEGGNAPFSYAWYFDGDLVENSTSPYYATNSQPVGSHHVYVEVKDADNNSAKTLSPEFNVLPSLTYMPSSSASPIQQPTTEPSQTPDRPQIKDFAPVIIPATMIFSAIVVVGLLVYFRKRRG
jgi:hypothetical protein